MSTEETPVPADPHGLLTSGKRLLGGDTVWDRFKLPHEWLRAQRRTRAIRYVDLKPALPPGRDAAHRYLYVAADIEARIAAEPPPALVATPAPTPVAPPPTPPRLPAKARARLRGPMPEVIVVQRRRAS